MKIKTQKIFIIKIILTYVVSVNVFAERCDFFCLLSKITEHSDFRNLGTAGDEEPFDFNKAQINRYIASDNSQSDIIKDLEEGPNSILRPCPTFTSTAATFSNFGTKRNGSDIFTYDENLSDTANIENQTPAPTPSSSITAELPDGDPETDGFYRYNDGDRNVFGTNSVIWQLTEAGKKLAENGMSMGIGDISKRGGGRLPPHQTHRDGKSVDMRFVGHDGQAKACVYTNRCYSRENTKIMLETLINVNPDNVRLVYLNDPILREEMRIKFPNVEFKNCAGHDNHLHVNFKE